MLTFMNSKLSDDWQISDKQYHIFQKSKSSMKYQIQTYILVRTWNLLFIYFTGVSNQTMKSIKCKKNLSWLKLHLTWLKLHLVIISALELKCQQTRKPFIIQYQKLMIFFRILPFHFIKSFSTIQFHVCF